MKAAHMPGEGFEPPTFGLQNRCTTAVLTRHRDETVHARRATRPRFAVEALKASLTQARINASRHYAKAIEPMAMKCSMSRMDTVAATRTVVTTSGFIDFVLIGMTTSRRP